MVVAAKRYRAEAFDAQRAQFAADAVAGLSETPKRLAPKYFYDAEGSRLFEAITRTAEYYPTRCELAVLRAHAADIAAIVPPGAALIEFGSGSSRKARLLLRACRGLAAYVPVDISPEMLAQEAAALRADFPRLTVRPVAADFTRPFALPREAAAAPVRVGFFPGSTIGNFEPAEAAAFLRHAAAVLGAGARLIVGVDLVKDEAVLNAAYNDAVGVTAQFNLNLLKRMNRELAANFHLDAFAHRAFFNRGQSRIEMHLQSLKRQRVTVAGEHFDFRADETIHTESSYKYSIASFGALARGSGWSPLSAWTDADGCFSVQSFALMPARPA